ncbi:hypothetical protein RN001_005920 [Aquatica leii]|uniref:Uncharacterized protein n=1 Tax=Aquatica leii TaxID=1421715 RepID=A0AAN7SAX3_9COLE|nr:hypothetical protein RN001_005920 [Aquatica leii]
MPLSKAGPRKDKKLGRRKLTESSKHQKGRSRYGKSLVIVRKRSNIGDIDKWDSTSKRQRDILLQDENIINDIQWLNSRSEPWDEVICKWKNTYQVRKLWKVMSVKDFYDEWRILKFNKAEVLINLYFEVKYPNSTLKQIVDWDTNFIYFSDTTFVAQLSVLPYLIPPKGKLNLDNKKIWKFSTAKTVKSIIYQAKIPGDITEIIKENKEIARAHKQTVQPYVIVEGRRCINFEISTS